MIFSINDIRVSIMNFTLSSYACNRICYYPGISQKPHHYYPQSTPERKSDFNPVESLDATRVPTSISQRLQTSFHSCKTKSPEYTSLDRDLETRHVFFSKFPSTVLSPIAENSQEVASNTQRVLKIGRRGVFNRSLTNVQGVHVGRADAFIKGGWSSKQDEKL